MSLRVIKVIYQVKFRFDTICHYFDARIPWKHDSIEKFFLTIS